MTNESVHGTDWSDDQIDLVVADYVEMLQFELAEQPYVKAHRNAALQELTGRTRGSIEFKHQNISAVLRTLGWPWILGYKPLGNYQNALLTGVERYLARFGEIKIPLERKTIALQDEGVLFVGPAPLLNTDDTSPQPELQRLIRKFDPATRDARNRQLGLLGEERAFHSERARLKAEGRDDLARKVRWVSQEDGDGAGYDILSFQHTGQERLVEVKTTTGHGRTPFFITANELSVSQERPDNYRIMRLFDFARIPQAFEISPPIDSATRLTPTQYRASFR